MKALSLLSGGAILLSLVAVADARSWDVAMDSTAKAGNVQLPAGDYSVKLDSGQALFRASDSGKTYRVPVKVEQSPRKFAETELLSKMQGNTEIVESIRLRGTTTELEFGK